MWGRVWARTTQSVCAFVCMFGEGGEHCVCVCVCVCAGEGGKYYAIMYI